MVTPNYSMLLVTATWNGKESFKLIPISESAPYAECIFDPESKVLVVISKLTKTALHMVPKLDPDGYPSVIQKGPNAGKQKQERKEIKVFYEYYIEQITDMKNLISNLAVNQDFVWEKFTLTDNVPVEDLKSE
jgi:hypothetical protein